MTKPFDPDWTTHPSAHLREFVEQWSSPERALACATDGVITAKRAREMLAGEGQPWSLIEAASVRVRPRPQPAVLAEPDPEPSPSGGSGQDGCGPFGRRCSMSDHIATCERCRTPLYEFPAPDPEDTP